MPMQSNRMLSLMHRMPITYFYINFADHAWCVEESEALPSVLQSEKMHPLNALCSSSLVYEEDRPHLIGFRDRVMEAMGNGSHDSCFRLQFRLVEQNMPVWYAVEIYPEMSESRLFCECTGQFRRLSDRDVMAYQMLRSCYDDMNPVPFTDVIEAHMAREPETPFAFIQFDVVRFKLINDNYGEATGTALLHHFLDVLGSFCSDEQHYIRLSSDIFMIVMPCGSKEEICNYIRRLEARLSGYQDMEYSFAFGVNIVTDRSVSTRIMGDSAAIARLSVKGKVIDNIGFYHAGLREKIRSKKNIEDYMRIALDEGQFCMYLQPKYSIASDRVIGAEALARWIHPKRGMISPMDFIPVFEQNGFIVKLDRFIWECACRKLDEWRRLRMPMLPISVNVSRVHLNRDTLADELEALLAKYDIPHRYFELEITESVENVNSDQTIRELKKRGFTLLMDDFGSGYSSLNMLNSTPFDIIKIDKDFLSSLLDSGRGQNIIRHTIAMSREIGLELIAEGVETKEQAEFLSSCGCDQAQGYYYSRPVPVAEFDCLLR